MMSAIERTLIPLGVQVSRSSLEGRDVFGGYFIWLHLPDGVTAKLTAAAAKDEENLIVSEGEQFEVHGDESAVKLGQWLRVCFAWEELETLEEGICRLGRVVRRIQGI